MADKAGPKSTWWLARVYEEAGKTRMPERLLVERLRAYLPANKGRWAGKLVGFQGRRTDDIDLADPATWDHAIFHGAESRVAFYVLPPPRPGMRYHLMMRAADLCFLQITAEDISLLVDQPAPSPMPEPPPPLLEPVPLPEPPPPPLTLDERLKLPPSSTLATLVAQELYPRGRIKLVIETLWPNDVPPKTETVRGIVENYAVKHGLNLGPDGVVTWDTVNRALGRAP
jgi:hypothetical protein